MSRTVQRAASILAATTLLVAAPTTAHAQYYPAYDMGARIRFLVTPRDARVYVDGYYAGVVDNFDGMFQRLSVAPGGHEVVLYLDGYRTVRQTAYVMAGSTFKVQQRMEKLAAGESSEPPPAAPPATSGGTSGVFRPPFPPQYPPASGSQPPSDEGTRVSNLGTLAINVQPGGAQIAIDGEPWAASDERAVLIVQVTEGRHRVEIRKEGFRPFSDEIEVTSRQTTPVNVSLSPE